MLAALLPNLILTAITVASDHNKGLTSYYDPYISCWDRPPTHQDGLPAAYSQSEYYNNLMLCSAAHGVPRANVGCFCPGSSGDIVCVRNIADPVLWSGTISLHDYGEENYDFPEWCRISCECITEGQAQAEHRGNINYYDSDFQSLRHMSGNLPSQSLSGSSSDDTSSSGTNGSDSAPMDSLDKDLADKNSKLTVLHDHCGNSCTSNKDCSSAGNTSCMCSIQSQQYQPGSGAVAFVAACIISLSGKREETKPCPCNGSYVSHACCESQAGLVWEAEEFKLGELFREE